MSLTMSENITGILKHRYKTTAELVAENPTLLEGEIGVDSDQYKIKVGDGSSAWNELSFIGGGISTDTIHNTTVNNGILIPLYVYPADIYTNTTYNGLIELAKANKTIPMIAIQNPGNGPGETADGNYTAAIKRLSGANIMVAGYVSTSYATRTIASVKADIDKWVELYPDTKGIFFDEMTYEDNQTYIDYYVELNRYAKSSGFTLTIANPGSPFAGGYQEQGAADIIVGWESNVYPTEAQAKEDWSGGASDYNVNKRAILIHSESEWDDDDFNLIKTYYGWVYVTEDLLSPNPWDVLSSYMSNMIDGIEPEVEEANKLATARTISLTGDASGSASFDGSADISINTTLTIPPANIDKKLLMKLVDDSKQFVESDNPETDGFYGWSVAQNSNYMIVSAPKEYISSNSSSGRVYIYEKTLLNDFKLIQTIENPVSSLFDFGWSVAISDEDCDVVNLFIGHPLDKGCYIYELNESTGQFDFVIKKSESSTSQYGLKVYTRGNYLVVADPYYAGSARGKIWIYNYTTAWTSYQSIDNPDEAAYDFFGSDISMYGDWLAVTHTTQAGKVFIYKHDGVDSFDSYQTITGGKSCALYENKLYVGNKDADIEATNDGSVSIYDWDEVDSFDLTTTLSSPYPITNGKYGTYIDADGDVLVVGAPGETFDGSTNSGTAYFYNSCGGVIIGNPNSSADSYFGSSLSIRNNCAVVGCYYGDTSTTNAGFAYHYFTP